MSFKIVALTRFQKDTKFLKKKFPKIKDDLIKLCNELVTNPTLGTSLGSDFFKVRVANSSTPTGKSGGFRVITYYKLNDILYLITIYSKTEQDSVSIESLQKIIKEELDE